MPKCQNAKMSKCQNTKMSKCQSAKMSKCQSAKNNKMSKCTFFICHFCVCRNPRPHGSSSGRCRTSRSTRPASSPRTLKQPINLDIRKITFENINIRNLENPVFFNYVSTPESTHCFRQSPSKYQSSWFEYSCFHPRLLAKMCQERVFAESRRN